MRRTRSRDDDMAEDRSTSPWPLARSRGLLMLGLRLLFVTMSIGLCLIFGEVGIRSYEGVRYGVDVTVDPIHAARAVWERKYGREISSMLDDELGWRTTPNYRHVGMEHSIDGSPYPVDISTDKDGFRISTAPDDPRPRVLVIGDSITYAMEVSDEQTYPAIVGRDLDLAVWAYGTGGYATLQEYLILDRFVDRIRPDLVLWQFYGNDFTNNTVELERGSLGNNNGRRRPYWVDGHIKHMRPTPQWLGLRPLADRYSRLGVLVLNQADATWQRRILASGVGVEQTIEAVGQADPEFARAVAITDDLFGMTKRRAGIPLAVLSCGALEGPKGDALAGILARHEIPYIPTGDAVRAAELRGEVVKHADGSHWNERGHEIAAQAIIDYLHAHPVVRGPEPTFVSPAAIWTLDMRSWGPDIL